MKNVFSGIILFLAVVAQTSIFPNLFPLGLIPDVALLIIIIWTAKSDFNAVLKWAIFGGFILDVASFWPIGINIFSFVAAAFVVNSLGKRFFTSQVGWKLLIFIVMVAVATIINYFIVSLLASIISSPARISQAVFEYFGFISIKDIGLKIIYNLAISALIYWPLERIDKIFSYYKKEIILKK